MLDQLSAERCLFMDHQVHLDLIGGLLKSACCSITVVVVYHKLLHYIRNVIRINVDAENVCLCNWTRRPLLAAVRFQWRELNLKSISLVDSSKLR